MDHEPAVPSLMVNDWVGQPAVTALQVSVDPGACSGSIILLVCHAPDVWCPRSESGTGSTRATRLPVHSAFAVSQKHTLTQATYVTAYAHHVQNKVSYRRQYCRRCLLHVAKAVHTLLLLRARAGLRPLKAHAHCVHSQLSQ